VTRAALAGWIALAAAVGAALPAAAHRLAPSLLEIRERGAGRIEVFWKTPLQRPVGADLRPVLPAECRPVGDPVPGSAPGAVTLSWSAVCDGLIGRTLGVRGLEESRTDALLRLELADGRSLQAVLRAGAAVFVVPERPQPWRVARDYVALGFWHILDGLDHLAFVLGLMLLVRGRRALVGTVTAFTVGHSVTLSLVVLGFVGLPSRLVELGIAASILVLAVELTRGEGAPASGLRRRPWLMAAAFGLLHGLGFAGALLEVGLPAGEVPVALLFFNLGIELGQLAFVAAVLLTRPALRALSLRGPAWLARAPAYGIGSLAAWWCLERTAAFF
jgi:hydrogenase/urease accessory protein HupE